jgi:hypothetical protein
MEVNLACKLPSSYENTCFLIVSQRASLRESVCYTLSHSMNTRYFIIMIWLWGSWPKEDVRITQAALHILGSALASGSQSSVTYSAVNKTKMLQLNSVPSLCLSPPWKISTRDWMETNHATKMWREKRLVVHLEIASKHSFLEVKQLKKHLCIKSTESNSREETTEHQ